VVLSHAHIDHSGNLPSLVKHGFAGPIFTTPATIDLCKWMLLDTAHIQEKDAEFLNKRRDQRRARGEENGIVEPLYTTPDAEATIRSSTRCRIMCPSRSRRNSVTKPTMRAHARLLLPCDPRSLRPRARAPGLLRRRGRPGLPIIRDPEKMPPVEYLIMESTYGGRLHKPADRVIGKLAEVVIRTAKRGGRIIVPAFAVGRTQQLVLLLHQLVNEKRIPNIPIFVDSPLAVNVTAVPSPAYGMFRRRDAPLPR